MRWSRALPVFSIAFGLIYMLAMYFNWPVFTYAPRLHAFFPLRYVPPNQGPGMFYYGWLVTAALGAAAVGIVVAYAEEKSRRRLPADLTWIVPPVLVLALLYILRDWFTH